MSLYKQLVQTIFNIKHNSHSKILNNMVMFQYCQSILFVISSQSVLIKSCILLKPSVSPWHYSYVWVNMLIYTLTSVFDHIRCNAVLVFSQIISCLVVFQGFFFFYIQAGEMTCYSKSYTSNSVLLHLWGYEANKPAVALWKSWLDLPGELKLLNQHHRLNILFKRSFIKVALI